MNYLEFSPTIQKGLLFFLGASLVNEINNTPFELGFDEKDETESTLKMMQNCVDEIHFGDDVYKRVDMSDKELSEFFDDMTTDMFSRVQEFFTTMPKLRHILDIKNPKTKKKSEYMLEGLADFFI